MNLLAQSEVPAMIPHLPIAGASPIWMERWAIPVMACALLIAYFLVVFAVTIVYRWVRRRQWIRLWIALTAVCVLAGFVYYASPSRHRNIVARDDIEYARPDNGHDTRGLTQVDMEASQ